MKKILYSIFAVALVVPTIASAATFSFAPASATLKPGQTFSTAVFVTPGANEKITTAKLSLDFSPSLLKVVSFTPTAGWIALPLPGSDLIDNIKGQLIKTGGLPAKVTAKKQFGTIVFKAKKAGKAKIGTNANSMLIDTANANKYIASSGANFTIKAPTPKQKPIYKKSVKKVVKTFTKKNTVEVAPAIASTTATTTSSSTLPVEPAAVSASGSKGSTGLLFAIIAGIIALALVVWLNRKRLFRRQ